MRQAEERSTPARPVGGLAGWVLEWMHALWLGAKMRREVKKEMCVLETLPIGGKKQLLLVSCAGERFLVGTGMDSVQTMVRVNAERTQEEYPGVRGHGDRL